MDLGLSEKVALITGSSRGIGRSIAHAFATEGARVAICGRGSEDLAETEQWIRATGADILAVEVDVSTQDGMTRFVEKARDRWGRVDIFVNNVGGGPGLTLLETPDTDFESSVNINMMTGVRGARSCVPIMRSQGGGTIIMIASIWGREAGGRLTYNVSKAAEISLCKALAKELAKDNIRVNSVAPGSILFPGGGWDKRVKADPEGMKDFVRTQLPMGRFGTPEEVANVVVFLASKQASWVSGSCIVVDGCQSHSNI